MRVAENAEKDQPATEENLWVGLKNSKSDVILKTRVSSADIFKTPEMEGFKETCLPVSLILGFFLAKSRRYEYTKEEDLKTFHSTYKQLNLLQRYPKSLKGLKCLKTIYLALTADLEMTVSGPFQLETIEKICDYFEINCTVLSHENIMFKYPKIPNLSIPHVFLLFTRKENEDIGHVDLIRNEDKFWKV